MRSAQRYTARGKRNTQKLEKNKAGLCAIETRDGRLTTVAERVKISTCSLLVLEQLRTFDTCVRGAG